MRKVAATNGQSVRRMDFFFVLSFWGATWGATVSDGCERLVDAVAVANFYGFLLKRLTLTTASPKLRITTSVRGSQGGQRFPGISAKLVRMCEITGNFHRCKKFFAIFCQRGWYGGNGGCPTSKAANYGRKVRRNMLLCH